MQVLCVNGEVLGIVTIKHQAGMCQKLHVVFLAEERTARPNLGEASFSIKWLTMEELKSLSKFVLEESVLRLLQQVESGGGVYPVSLLECMDKRRGIDKVAEQPELQRGASLEDQMLAQAGYGNYGEYQVVGLTKVSHNRCKSLNKIFLPRAEPDCGGVSIALWFHLRENEQRNILQSHDCLRLPCTPLPALLQVN